MMLAVCLPCVKCVFWLVLNVCVSLLFTMLDYETGEFGGAVHCHSCFIQDQDHYQNQGKPSKCLLIIILIIIYHACFTSEVLQKLDYQKLFLMCLILLYYYIGYHYASS